MTERLLIAGGPRCGKTTLADTLASGRVVRHTDDLIATHEWSAASEEAARWLDDAGPWVIEGVTVVRAIRKWLAAHEDGKPADVVVWLNQPFAELTKGQASMLKSCETIWAEVWPELARRGVYIRLNPGPNEAMPTGSGSLVCNCDFRFGKVVDRHAGDCPAAAVAT